MSKGLPLVGALLALAMLVVVPAAEAKGFGPGDLRACNAKRCVPIANPDVLPAIGEFYYWGQRLEIAKAPRMAAPAFELRFRNGYATGIVASPRLDRFLSYGVHLERFRRGTWYRLPASISAELRGLTTGLKPLRVTREAILRSR